MAGTRPREGSRVSIEIRILGAGDVAALTRVAPGVFDHDVNPALTREFLADPRHHLAVALDGDTVVGFASGVHYVHPDKPAELWVNEVGVAPSHQRQGLGRRLLGALFSEGRRLGCRDAWVLTSPANEPAVRLYQAAGGQELTDASVMFTFRLGSVQSE
jgi:ribosomal protein S18 acetylase RimI-like enzyme